MKPRDYARLQEAHDEFRAKMEIDTYITLASGLLFGVPGSLMVFSAIIPSCREPAGMTLEQCVSEVAMGSLFLAAAVLPTWLAYRSEQKEEDKYKAVIRELEEKEKSERGYR